MKLKILVPTLALTALFAASALAAGFSTPATIVSSLTGISEEVVGEMRQDGQTFGQIAAENDVMADFRQQMLEYKFSIIDERVAEEAMTPEEGEALKEALAERVESCHGNPAGTKSGMGLGFGGGMGRHMGNGSRNGQGIGQGNGFGRGR